MILGPRRVDLEDFLVNSTLRTNSCGCGPVTSIQIHNFVVVVFHHEQDITLAHWIQVMKFTSVNSCQLKD